METMLTLANQRILHHILRAALENLYICMWIQIKVKRTFVCNCVYLTFFPVYIDCFSFFLFFLTDSICTIFMCILQRKNMTYSISEYDAVGIRYLCCLASSQCGIQSEMCCIRFCHAARVDQAQVVLTDAKHLEKAKKYCRFI